MLLAKTYHLCNTCSQCMLFIICAGSKDGNKYCLLSNLSREITHVRSVTAGKKQWPFILERRIVIGPCLLSLLQHCNEFLLQKCVYTKKTFYLLFDICGFA